MNPNAMGSRNLSEADLRGALELIRRVESVPDLATFWDEALVGVPELVQYDVGMFAVVNPAARTGGAVRDDPPGTITREAWLGFERNFEQEPTVAHQVRFDASRALKTSDFLAERRWLGTDLYNECHRLLGVRHSLGLKLEGPTQELTCLTLCRARGDFTERDRELLTLLRFHLSAARRNAELREGRFRDTALYAEGLSPREVEVLRLVAEGLINRAIARRLEISARTVQKHLERIHRKLGVGTRTAAVSRARELSRQRP